MNHVFTVTARPSVKESCLMKIPKIPFTFEAKDSNKDHRFAQI